MKGEWSEPWHPVAEGEQRLLENELKKELADAHPLAGLSLRVVARRHDQDDVLVVFDAIDSGRVAEVHLTWSGRKEGDSRWPRTAIFNSMEEWRRHCHEAD